MLFAGLWITLSKKVIMGDKRANEKITIKQIFNDHWSKFKQLKWHTIPENMRDSVEEAVSKMWGCGDVDNHFIWRRLDRNPAHHPVNCPS